MTATTTDYFLDALTQLARQAATTRGPGEARDYLADVIARWVHVDRLPELAAQLLGELATEQRAHDDATAALLAAGRQHQEQLGEYRAEAERRADLIVELKRQIGATVRVRDQAAAANREARGEVECLRAGMSTLVDTLGRDHNGHPPQAGEPTCPGCVADDLVQLLTKTAMGEGAL